SLKIVCAWELGQMANRTGDKQGGAGRGHEVPILTVGRFMRTPVISIEEHQTVQAAVALMGAQRIRHLPVLKDGRLIGIISSRDCQRLAAAQPQPGAKQERSLSPATTPVRDVMVSRVLTATQDMRISEAARLMSERKIGCLPVVIPVTMEPVGIITETDMMRILARLLNQQESQIVEKQNPAG
ncbi:MAG TPA: CBS domain-containing protein, partial [Planctomycetota bacterium]|nr:CBS domain-containing protein [Planctomycetota bacterium]